MTYFKHCMLSIFVWEMCLICLLLYLNLVSIFAINIHIAIRRGAVNVLVSEHTLKVAGITKYRKSLWICFFHSFPMLQTAVHRSIGNESKMSKIPFRLPSGWWVAKRAWTLNPNYPWPACSCLFEFNGYWSEVKASSNSLNRVYSLILFVSIHMVLSL